MKSLSRLLIPFVFALILTLSITSLAQSEVCPALVQQALESLNNLCGGTARNQACYGNRLIDAVPRADIAALEFDEPGDIESLTNIQALNMSAMIQPEEWGVALMRIQANLPDTLPGQNVTMILVGDVTIEDAGAVQVTFEVTSTGNINVRSGPGTNNRALTALTSGQTVIADGRNAAGDWLRIILDDDSSGWVSAPLVTTDGDVMALAEVDARTDAAGARFGPMQAFYFRTGIGETQCAEAPRDGILIQTPSGSQRITLLVNEVSIDIGSTVFLTANPGNTMRAAVVEGDAIISAAGTTVTAVEGTQAVIPLDEAGIAAGAPTLEPYDSDELAPLAGLIDAMPEQVPIAQPLTEEEIILLLRGSLLSTLRGEICAQESMTFSQTLGPPASEGSTLVGATITGDITARAGTTATFTAAGESRLLSGQQYYLRLLGPGGQDRTFEINSTERVLTHTFTAEQVFQVLVAGTTGDTVEVIISCGG